MISNDLYKLKEFFGEHSKVALGFTGGVNSSFLLYIGKQSGADVKAYYVKTAFQPQSELDHVERLARQFRVKLTVLEYDIFQHRDIIRNNEKRCLLCKEKIISLIKKQAAADGFKIMIEGSDASDLENECQTHISNSQGSLYSPLKMLGITKPKVRMLSKKAGHLVWDKPSYSCLAAQIPAGTPVTVENLQKIERAERVLSLIGFTDFKVGVVGSFVKLKVPYSQMEEVVEKRKKILDSLKPDFDTVVLDLKGP